MESNVSATVPIPTGDAQAQTDLGFALERGVCSLVSLFVSFCSVMFCIGEFLFSAVTLFPLLYWICIGLVLYCILLCQQQGVDENKREAMVWYRKAAIAGNRVAQCNVAVFVHFVLFFPSLPVLETY